MCRAVFGLLVLLGGPSTAGQEQCAQFGYDGDTLLIQINLWLVQRTVPPVEAHRSRELAEEALDLATAAREQGNVIVRLCGWSEQYDALFGAAVRLELYQRGLFLRLRETKP